MIVELVRGGGGGGGEMRGGALAFCAPFGELVAFVSVHLSVSSHPVEPGLCGGSEGVEGGACVAGGGDVVFEAPAVQDVADAGEGVGDEEEGRWRVKVEVSV